MIQTTSAQTIHTCCTEQAPSDRGHSSGVIMNKSRVVLGWCFDYRTKKFFTVLFQGICKHDGGKRSSVHGITLTNG